MDHILSQLNPVYIFINYFFKIHFKVMFTYETVNIIKKVIMKQYQEWQINS